MRAATRRPLVLVARGAVLVIMAVGSVGYSLANKTVTITADGHTRTVHTFAGDVSSALNRAGVTIGAHDVVEPDLRDAVHDGSTIVVGRGRRLSLTVDGVVHDVWVTEPTLVDAVTALGLTLAGDYVSVPLTSAVPLGGLAVTVRTPTQVTLSVGGAVTTVTTTAPTVSDLLAAQGVALGPWDVVSTPLSLYPANGTTVTVVRVTRSQWLQRTHIAMPVVRVADSRLARGRLQLAHGGRVGIEYRLWGIEKDNGRLVLQKLLQQSTVAPRAKVIRYGTQARVTLAATKSTVSKPVASKPAPSRPVVRHTAPAKTSGLNWPALARCESGGDPRSVDRPYYGLYQFSLGTWESVGGRGLPSNATSAEQTYRAELLYAQQGRSPWPACGRYL